MRVLVGCEFSGIVRDAFRARGHDAWSCDIGPSERPGPHRQEDILAGILAEEWDMLIAFPPCTKLCNAGAQHRDDAEMFAGVEFVRKLWNAAIPKIGLENPAGALSTWFRRPTQYIQPWQFGHGETKRTGLWLKGLPELQPTEIVAGRVPRSHMEPQSRNRWKNRSRTYEGIAAAMAAQWG